MAKTPRDGQKIDHIVQASGVSRSTVFRYLAGKTVRTGAATAIERALSVLKSPGQEEVGGTREFLVSVVPSYTRFRGYAEVLEGVLQRAYEAGVTMRIGSHPGLGPPPQGVIMIGKKLVDEDLESAQWKECGVPCVMVNRIPDEIDRSWVSVDCRAAAQEAVEHLLAQGCRRVAVWNDELSRVSRDKFRGYCDALEAAGLDFDPILAVKPGDATLEEAFSRLMNLSRPPDGWFGLDDETAFQVVSLAATRGVAVPGDLAVVGMNDIVTAPHMVPSLSSVRLPFREMGRGAVDALLSLVEHPRERSVRILLRHELVIRGSSDRLR